MDSKFKPVHLKAEVHGQAEKIRAVLGKKSVAQVVTELINDKRLSLEQEGVL